MFTDSSLRLADLQREKNLSLEKEKKIEKANDRQGFDAQRQINVPSL